MLAARCVKPGSTPHRLDQLMSLPSICRVPVTVPEQLAAVDLGSNSFHVIVATVRDGQLHVIDRLRNTLSLATGLDPDTKMLSEESMQRALAFLARIGQRLHGFPPNAVRAVGTNTLRIARNGEAFRERAEVALGHRIEVIAGREEARLIYLGVAHGLGGSPHRRLVIDIGGGSTEFIIGEGFDPLHRESLYMGCVNMSLRHFAGGKLGERAMAAAELDALQELEPIESVFQAAERDTVIGCSGTIKSIAAVCRAEGWCEHGISAGALARMREAMLAAGHVDRLELKTLRPDRLRVLGGGVAVLSACFQALGIERMAVSQMALREGLLFDLLGRIRHEDVRGRTVRSVAERYGVDAAQAVRVSRTARMLLDQVALEWDLDPSRHADMLLWAAQLHEVGLAVSHSQYHKHGAYILGEADLAGFSRQEQAMLASLVRGHRRKFPLASFDALPGEDASAARRLCVLLRLAVDLHRARSPTPLPALLLRARDRSLHLALREGWLVSQPLTRVDLDEEAAYLREAGFSFSFT
jgi:exopolyphosphatase/guanosine-5'-triphosphate,3'-diphosphate pyrophosphatase